MDTWLSILEFCRLWKREIIRYGIAGLLCLSAISTSRWAVAFFVMGGIFVMFAYDRWGEPWRKRGESLTKRKKP